MKYKDWLGKFSKKAVGKILSVAFFTLVAYLSMHSISYLKLLIFYCCFL